MNKDKLKKITGCGIPNFLEICRKVYELYIQMEEFFLVQEFSKHP